MSDNSGTGVATQRVYKSMAERRADYERAGAGRDQSYFMALEWEVDRLRSVMEDAAHLSELGRDVARYLRVVGLGQELTARVQATTADGDTPATTDADASSEKEN